MGLEERLEQEASVLTALAALQNFTRHNPRVRGSISFFIKYIGPFHKLLLLVHLATHSFYELLKFLDNLEKPRETAELNHTDVLAITNNPLCYQGSSIVCQHTGQLDFIP